MSGEEENKITSTEKSVKIKDPKRVELGKRLAKISKEAKARKKLERESAKNQKIEMIDFKYVVGGVAVLAGIFGIYVSYKKDKRETKQEQRFEKVEEKIEEQENVYISRKNKCLENL